MNNKYINIMINNKSILTRYNYNILQACNENNINIPKFCYHQELSIAGNCRMCLVEVKGINKPIASCAIPLVNDMTIFTNSKLVKKAREGILEFILINHPLDCPICDQGGECDLQDQSLVFGSDKGRFYEYKRSVNDKDCGPFIKTIMTRCIHCTRCIRYLDEIAGFKYLGLIGRGNNIEISNFITKSIFSELSGNIIDLCPVGALTLKPYSFKARPWELNIFNSIDILDPFNVNIRVDVRDSNVLRILPIFNDLINENWISDITRYSFDGFNSFRLVNPLKNVKNIFISVSWFETLNTLTNFIDNKNINFILGNFIDMETSFILKKISLLKLKQNNITINYLNIKMNNSFNDFRNNYFMSNNIVQNFNIYDNIILLNANLRLSNPLLNLKLKNFFKLGRKVFSIGSSFYNNFNIYNYGINCNDFINLLNGKLELNLLLLKKKNLIILDYSLLNNNFGIDWYHLQTFINKFLFLNFLIFNNFSSNSNLFNEIHLNNSLKKFNDISFNNLFSKLQKTKNEVEINYFINTSLAFSNSNILFKSPVYNIFQGSHYLNNVNFNFLLPSVNFLEKNAIYTNFLGYYQKTKFILYPPKNSRSDWKILYILFNSLFNFVALNFNDLAKYKFDYNLIYNQRFLIDKPNFLLQNIYLNYFKFLNSFSTSTYFNFNRSNQILLSSQNIFTIFKKIKKTNSNFY